MIIPKVRVSRFINSSIEQQTTQVFPIEQLKTDF